MKINGLVQTVMVKGIGVSLFILMIFLSSCKLSDTENNSLTQVSKEELIEMSENYEFPDYDNMSFKNLENQTKPWESIREIFTSNKHVLDFYKDTNGTIVEGRMRLANDKDKELIKEINRTKAVLNKEEINEIKSLISPKLKSYYLDNLWREDQDLRGGQESEITSKYGRYSEEHKQYLKKTKHLDEVVFMKMKNYLEIHGYPQDISLYEGMALSSFPTIIGHNHNYDEQKELIQYLYTGYQKGHCSLKDLIWVMGEIHESSHSGERYKMKSNIFNEDQEFKELNEVLGLGFVKNGELIVKP